jgi:hypothetical protein
MMTFEVVGFTPPSMGDLVIVPSEIAAQMGSDYDVDKLYVYTRPYIAEGNNIKAVKPNDESSQSLYRRMFDIADQMLSSKALLKYMITPISSANLEGDLS